MAIGMLPFDVPEIGQQSLGETMPKYAIRWNASWLFSCSVAWSLCSVRLSC